MKDFNKYIVSSITDIRTAIKKMDEGGIGFLVVVDASQNIIGVITDGDFRRAILNGISLDENIMKITNKKFISIGSEYNDDDIRNIFNTTVIKHIPVIDDGKLIDLITKEEYFGIKIQQKYPKLNLPVLIMAGGKGTRLDPFTRILPKALIPFGNKAMIEVIMDEYAKYGMKNFYISINHKGRMIRAYFEEHESDYTFQYITEDKPLGTAGAFKYLEGKINTSFFVSNCDISIKEDYTKIYKFHQKRNFSLTLVASIQNYIVPYGVCEIEYGGILKKIIEKPQYDFLVNTGMYLVEPSILKLIPQNEKFDVTDLINKVHEKGLNVGVYPISEKSYIDVGQLAEYKKVLNLLLEG